MSDLVKRLRDMRCQHDQRTGDEAADRIEQQERTIADLRMDIQQMSDSYQNALDELASVKAEWMSERDSHEHTLGLLAKRDAEFARYKAWHDAVMGQPSPFNDSYIVRPEPLEEKP